nr:hypothetical protein BaRGS_006086 [Batillaria attramentaria]
MAVDMKLMLVLMAAASVAAARHTWAGVEMMSIQMAEAERRQAPDAPNLPDLAKQLGLNTLVQLVKQAGLADALSGAGPFTVFGPTDAAFSALPSWAKEAVKNVTVLTEILKYHVLSTVAMSKDIKDEMVVDTLQGLPIRFNIYPNNGVYTAQCSPIDLKNVDKKASNGVLHELTRVMIPPAGDIVDAAIACPVFKTLVTAVKAADLVDTLKGKGPFTVFAPTDKAFAKIPKATLDNLLSNKTALTAVLTYHVAPLTYCSAGIVSYDSIKTVNGAKVKISVAGGTVKLNNNVKVVAGGADGSVTNGVVHAIDTVLMPPGFDLNSLH